MLTPPWVKPCSIPNSTGKPIAPKDTQAESAISATTAAATGGTPNNTSSGAPIAAGVPKPALPSIKAPNNQQIIITCTRASALMLVKPARMVSMAPEYFRVLSRNTAPKMMVKGVMADSSPSRTDAANSVVSICQINTAASAVTIMEMGIALDAGILSNTRKIITLITGVKLARS